MQKKAFRLKAFTLIELLIVVAIIAILAAIAVPNFLEAQTRSKVSRTKADMRTTATALEAYYVDNNSYVPSNEFGTSMRIEPFANTSDSSFPILERLSTPVAYLSSSLLTDPFSVKSRKSAATASAMATVSPISVDSSNDAAAHYNSYIYQAVNPRGRALWIPDSFSSATEPLKAHGWILHSVGPDSTYYNLGGVLANDFEKTDTINLIYDPTNGTISEGSLWRAGGSTSGNPSEYAAGQGLVRAIESQD